ncbi:MAG: hypothetical protein O2954_17040, partial [bacterium]|nr:hypothetical protein [bacterium]
YFSPQHDLKPRHGKALRYDTHGDFKNPDSWSAYDASNTDGLSTKGYYGAVFDGRYIIYPPRRDPDNFHSRVLRYDTHGDFKNPDSWSAYESRGASSSQSAAFDGQYIYFCPGQKAVPKTDSDTTSNDGSPSVTGMSADQLLVSSGDVMRYDTTGNFTDPSSWITHDISGTGNLDTRDYDGAVFDGRYIYFAPLSYGAVLRYDTQSDFQNKQSWTAFNAVPLGMRRCVGAVFDGQYIYFVPYGKSEHAIRYNTAGDFTDPTSWNAYHLPQTSALDTLGYDGAFFDGRYIYYVPYWDEKTRYHGVVLRYDTTGDFTHPTSWKAADAGLTDGLKTVGFNAGATDGRYLYFAAWMDGTGYPERIVGNGRVLRYDTTGNRAAFSLRFSDLGHNGGLCAALPGARFLVNTVNGPKSISANRPPQPGRQHLAGVYDGQTISLYINGQCVNQQSASGAIVPCTEDIAIGNILNGLGQFSGRISEIRISSCARSETWLRTQVQNQANPAEFCRIAT